MGCYLNNLTYNEHAAEDLSQYWPIQPFWGGGVESRVGRGGGKVPTRRQARLGMVRSSSGYSEDLLWGGLTLELHSIAVALDIGGQISSNYGCVITNAIATIMCVCACVCIFSKAQTIVIWKQLFKQRAKHTI